MAGPSQAGRFKPRKPAKKIRIGASASASGSATTTTTLGDTDAPKGAATSASLSARSSSSRSSSTGRGRGRGRGGRTRLPTPHGAVFFTGNAPPTVVAKKKSSAASSSSSTSSSAAPTRATKDNKATDRDGKTITKKESVEEIVVGQLDVSIGGSTVVVDVDRQEENDKTESRQKTSDGPSSRKVNSRVQPSIDTYDSDSTDEALDMDESQASTNALPIELPFPVAPLPVGIGGTHQRSVMYSCQNPQETTQGRSDPVLTEALNDPPLVSPFVDWTDAKLRQEERDSWFLFQFPTRLPAIQSIGTAVPDAVNSEPSMTPDTPHSMPMDVSTAPTNTKCFDNALSQAPAGRLGRMVVYKSGRTELIMGGDNGSPEIRLNVTEGLPCGFVQQAVAIDTEESTYIPLGDVKRTVVVTPNVKYAFSGS